MFNLSVRGETIIQAWYRAGYAIAALRGWRRYLAAFLAGSLSVAALAPVQIFVVLFVSLPVLIWLLDGVDNPDFSPRRTIKQAALIGGLFGFGYFLAGLYWIGFAFFVDAKTFGWLAPLAVIGLPAGLSLFPAAAAAIARLYWPPGYRRIISFAIVWTLIEWLRGHILTGFPWNMLGDAFAASDAWLQAGALVGPYGLGFLAVLIFASPAVVDSRTATPLPGAPMLSVPWRAPLAALLTLCLLWLGGAMRLALATSDTVDGVSLRLVQANVAQKDKWRRENRAAVLGQYLRISAAGTPENQRGLDQITHLIWPESALPFLLAREPLVLSAISRMLPRGVTLITGAQRGEPDPETASDRLERFYNSLYLIDDEGRIVDTYDKAHLTPFGEYLPMQNFLEWIGLEQLTRMKGGFQAGAGVRALDVPRAPAATPLICYEIIFPGALGSLPERPGWIVNVTNDAWFGESSGPYQHFLQARQRAIEQGLPVVRAAGTGISGVIDAYGRIQASIGLNQSGVLDAALPRAIGRPLYARLGDGIMVLMLVIAALAGVWFSVGKDSKLRRV